MSVAVASSSNLQALEDASQPTSRASSPTSPTTSVSFQQAQGSRVNVNVNGSLTSTPTSAYPSHALEAPPGVSYPEFLRSWTDAHVALWLTEIRCGHHAATFKANDIRGDVLLELDQMTLKEMGMNSVGDRVRILNGVKHLRQKCSSSTALTSILNRPRASEHSRNSSISSDHGTAARTGARRLESGRPAPLHLPPNGGSSDLPRLVRDGQDSARLNAAMRPLPVQPNSATTHGTPTTAHSRTNLPPLPPPPRGQPPLPPIARTPRNIHHTPGTPSTSGRRTPTLPDAPLALPQAGLLTPSSQNQGPWYGLPSDPRQGNNHRTPSRSTSPLPFPPSQPPVRNASRAATEHARNGSYSASTPTSETSNKPLPRRVGNGTHPYASSQLQQAHGLSPIAESFVSGRSNASGMNPSPASFRSLNVPFRPGTPSHNTPSLDDLRRKLIKFTLPEEGMTVTINVTDCSGGVEVLTKALKKLYKLGPDGSESIESTDGGLSVDGWGAFLERGQNDSNRGPLSEAELLSLCQAPPNDPAREHGLILRKTAVARRAQSPPSPPLLVSDDGEDALDKALAAEPPVYTKAMKRASSVSILSGLGVPLPDKVAQGPAAEIETQNSASPTKGSKKAPSKLRNFFGQRPPSELITTHLAAYFPNTEKKVLERTRRQSMLRQSGVPGRRDSIISFSTPSQSRFSVSTLGSQRTSSPRVSMSSASMTAVDRASSPYSTLETDDGTRVDEPPRLSLSTDDGHSVDLTAPGSATSSTLSPHLLPPVAFPSESLSESLNLSDSQGSLRSSRRMSTASKRMSYITELRSKRDRSDTASLMTVDEITAEVESRQEAAKSGDSDEWTKVDMPDNADRESIKETEDEEMSEEEEDEEEGDETATDDDDEPGKAIMSTGERTIKWIKGALIGAGSFGKVYLGMDAATGLLMAVKQVELPTGSAPNEERKKAMLSALEREIELLRDLHHENIVQYHSSCIDDDHLNIFLEYVPGGSVTSLLRNYGAFEEPLVRNWVRQILLGLNYLHERDIIHRDIKGANMLVDNKGGIKISDFGISKKIDDNLLPGHRAHRPSLQGSVFWMAPEVVQQKAYTFKADIWSVGCLVVEMLTGEHPWPHLSQMQAIFKVGSAKAKPSIPPDISPEAVDFLEKTFELDHELRPSAADLLKHPWIANQPSPFGQ
ncbi:hypothetical protein C8Q70DRAFT_942656 [Cubamyces menziesii]|nr:hypothetical protein C8Q70DRAFT_942656 [Cubamyces menziesii]